MNAGIIRITLNDQEVIEGKDPRRQGFIHPPYLEMQGSRLPRLGGFYKEQAPGDNRPGPCLFYSNLLSLAIDSADPVTRAHLPRLSGPACDTRCAQPSRQ